MERIFYAGRTGLKAELGKGQAVDALGRLTTV
jgi:hypothetical protein